MIDSKFFIDNKEVIALWIIFSILFLFVIEIISEYFDNRKAKKIKMQKKNKLIAREERKKVKLLWELNFHRNFEKYVVNF